MTLSALLKLLGIALGAFLGVKVAERQAYRIPAADTEPIDVEAWLADKHAEDLEWLRSIGHDTPEARERLRAMQAIERRRLVEDGWMSLRS